MADTNSYLDLSDEEMLNQSAPPEMFEEASIEDEVVEPEEIDDESEEEDDTADDDESEPVVEGDEDDADDEDDDDSDGTAPAVEEDDNKEEESVKAKEEETKEGELNPIDYKAEYERLTSSFKANGKDITVSNVDDAIALMQMGANYNKKMAALKPNLKLLKLLENNKLLDESKLSYLIDLDKKDPAAITKLIKDSGIDPLDVDVNKDSEYKPKTYTVDEKEIELDEVLGDLQETDTYSKTLDIVGNKWDGSSKQVITQNPQLLRLINDHVANGVYEIISKEVDRERMLGRLNGVSDINAYRLIGDTIEAKGGFEHLNPAKKAPQVVVPTTKKAPDPALISKKRAASSTQKAAPNKVPEDFNPLAMSDEAFSKLVVSKYL